MKIKNKKIISYLSTAFIASVIPFAASAAANVTLQNPIAAESVPELFGAIILAVLGIVGSIALLMFIYGGFLWLTSGGIPERIKKGRDTMMWAAIGLAFIFSSYMIADFIIKSLTVAQGA